MVEDRFGYSITSIMKTSVALIAIDNLIVDLIFGAKTNLTVGFDKFCPIVIQALY